MSDLSDVNDSLMSYSSDVNDRRAKLRFGYFCTLIFIAVIADSSDVKDSPMSISLSCAWISLASQLIDV